VVEIVRISLGWDGCKQARLNFDCPKNEVRNVGFIQTVNSMIAVGVLSGRILGGDDGLKRSEESCRRVGDPQCTQL
jgi:hypothetical protein